MSFFLSPFFYLSDEQQPELSQKIMENLWNSANKSEGTLRRPLPLHTNDTAEMTAMIEALSFLGPHGLEARDEQSCIYYDS